MDSEGEFILTKGASMWPTLREGELVRGRWRPADAVRPGSICGYRCTDKGLIIHRFLGIIKVSYRDTMLMRTAGDFSGRDKIQIAPAKLLVVEKVLRGGRWIRPGNSIVYSAISILTERISCYHRRSGIIFPQEPISFLGRWWNTFEKVSR